MFIHLISKSDADVLHIIHHRYFKSEINAINQVQEVHSEGNVCVQPKQLRYMDFCVTSGRSQIVVGSKK